MRNMETLFKEMDSDRKESYKIWRELFYSPVDKDDEPDDPFAPNAPVNEEFFEQYYFVFDSDYDFVTFFYDDHFNEFNDPENNIYPPLPDINDRKARRRWMNELLEYQEYYTWVRRNGHIYAYLGTQS